jgi:tetratricopeptide (TPR) repeat protein
MNMLLSALLLQAATVESGLLEVRAFLAKQDAPGARRKLDAMRAQWPSDGRITFLSGFTHYLFNELPAAVKELGLARRQVPADPRPPLYLALTLESLGEDPEPAFLSAIQLEEASARPEADTFLAYARYLMERSELARAEPLIARALQLGPQARAAHYESGRLLLRKGDLAGAAKAGELALARAADGIQDEQVLYLLVRVYHRMGRADLAAPHLGTLQKLRKRGGAAGGAAGPQREIEH